jgi:hypothetical protein
MAFLALIFFTSPLLVHLLFHLILQLLFSHLDDLLGSLNFGSSLFALRCSIVTPFYKDLRIIYTSQKTKAAIITPDLRTTLLASCLRFFVFLLIICL